MLVVPVARPAIIPEVELMTATDGDAEDQVPLPASVNVAAAPSHIAAGPEMAAGDALTVTTIAVVQPVPNE